MSDSSWEFLKMENEQLKQLRKFVWIKIAKLRESTNLCVEIKKSRRQAKDKLGHVVQILIWHR